MRQFAEGVFDRAVEPGAPNGASEPADRHKERAAEPA
jgi:hypothetical protein